jgi:hypothetical protein
MALSDSDASIALADEDATVRDERKISRVVEPVDHDLGQ